MPYKTKEQYNAYMRQYYQRKKVKQAHDQAELQTLRKMIDHADK